ncbi:MAG: hypothetical protein EOP00_23795 [Pedobacter sp.]|nr:MAG: hypothetical protein EOP00_23795 [Pedobacter sp.]
MNIKRIVLGAFLVFAISTSFSCKKTACYSCVTETNVIGDDGSSEKTTVSIPACDQTKEQIKMKEEAGTYKRTYTESGIKIDEDAKTTCTEVK